MDNLSTIIIDPTENVISILGNGYFQSFLSSGFVGRGFAILSDKRIYFRGNCLKKTNFGYITVKKESVVDIEDVTGTGYEIINPVSMLVTGGMNLLLSILSFVLSTISYSTRSVGIVFGAIFLFFAFFFVCFYFVRKKTIFEINYAGGSIGFNLGFMSKSESDDFHRALRIAKDNYKLVRSGAPPGVADQLQKQQYQNLQQNVQYYQNQQQPYVPQQYNVR